MEGQRRYYLFLLERAAAGNLLADPYTFRPSVLVQQALVLAGGRGHVTAKVLAEVLPVALRPGFRADVTARILEAMVEEDLFEPPRGGRYVLAESSERQYEAGRVHGNIEPDAAIEVLDRLTGDIVGTIAPRAAADPSSLQLGGQGWRAVRESEGRLLTDATREASPVRFTPRRVPAMGHCLARAFAEALGAPAGIILQGRVGADVVLLHGLGAAGMVLLRAGLEQRHGKSFVRRASPMVFLLGAPFENLPRPSEAEVSRLVAHHEKTLAGLYGLGPYHRVLPADIRRAAVRAASHIDEAARFLREARLGTDLEEEAPAFWRAL